MHGNQPGCRPDEGEGGTHERAADRDRRAFAQSVSQAREGERPEEVAESESSFHQPEGAGTAADHVHGEQK